MLGSALMLTLATPDLSQKRLDFDRFYVIGGAGYGAGPALIGVRSGENVACLSCGKSWIEADLDPEANARFQADLGSQFNRNWRGQIDIADRFNQYGAIDNGALAFTSATAANGHHWAIAIIRMYPYGFGDLRHDPAA
jgi:hypothetical protein